MNMITIEAIASIPKITAPTIAPLLDFSMLSPPIKLMGGIKPPTPLLLARSLKCTLNKAERDTCKRYRHHEHTKVVSCDEVEALTRNTENALNASGKRRNNISHVKLLSNNLDHWNYQKLASK